VSHRPAPQLNAPPQRIRADAVFEANVLDRAARILILMVDVRPFFGRRERRHDLSFSLPVLAGEGWGGGHLRATTPPVIPAKAGIQLWLAQFSEIARTLPDQRHAVKEYILNI
jgi:hypothetical protein